MLGEGWRSIGESSIVEDGRFVGEASADGFADTTVAPRFQLAIEETDTAAPASPEMKLSRGTLTLDFGTVVLSGIGADSPLDRAASDEIARLRVKLIAAEAEQAHTAARLAQSEQSLADSLEVQADLQLQIDQFSTAEADSPLIGDLAGEVASSLGTATSPSASGGFRVEAATVTLKGYLVGSDRFRPLDVADGARGASAGASEISFNIRRPPSEPVSASTMPDVVGLTPVTAQRAVRPLGVSVQIVEIPGSPAGAVLKQHPAAGTELAPGATIILQVAVTTSEE